MRTKDEAEPAHHNKHTSNRTKLDTIAAPPGAIAMQERKRDSKEIGLTLRSHTKGNHGGTTGERAIAAPAYREREREAREVRRSAPMLPKACVDGPETLRL